MIYVLKIFATILSRYSMHVIKVILISVANII